MTPREWWKNPDNAKRWIRRARLYDAGDNRSLTFVIDKIQDRFNRVLEVGAGDGRLIGKLSKIYPNISCNSIDINPILSKHVKDNHGVSAYIGDVTNLPFVSNSFDLIFTFQVLQHIDPDEIKRAILELKRVSSKEVWLFEGWNIFKQDFDPHGHMRHKGDGGTWYYDHSRIPGCYHVEHLEESKAKNGLGGVRLYKIKV